VNLCNVDLLTRIRDPCLLVGLAGRTDDLLEVEPVKPRAILGQQSRVGCADTFHIDGIISVFVGPVAGTIMAAAPPSLLPQQSKRPRGQAMMGASLPVPGLCGCEMRLGAEAAVVVILDRNLADDARLPSSGLSPYV
jgi:hypothetical protein